MSADFHDGIRALVVTALSQLILTSIAYALVLRWRRADEADAPVVGFVLSAVSLSIATSTVLALLAGGCVVAGGGSSAILARVWSHLFLLVDIAVYLCMRCGRFFVARHAHQTPSLLSSSLPPSLFLPTGIPFAYFFTEAEGFSNTRTGLRGRIYETTAVLGLLGVLLAGFTFVLQLLFGASSSSWDITWVVRGSVSPVLFSYVALTGAVLVLGKERCTCTSFMTRRHVSSKDSHHLEWSQCSHGVHLL